MTTLSPTPSTTLAGEMLQAFFPDAGYNDRVAWPFAKLAGLWGGRGSRRPDAARPLRDALVAAARESCLFTVIDVKLERGDISPILARLRQRLQEARLQERPVKVPGSVVPGSRFGFRNRTRT